jgi:predicted TIM-barrel fold metal-dependent hydrolase
MFGAVATAVFLHPPRDCGPKLPGEYLRLLHVDTMGFRAPHVREAVEVSGADRVMFGSGYGPAPLDPKEHVDIVNTFGISPAGRRRTCGGTLRRHARPSGVAWPGVLCTYV